MRRLDCLDGLRGCLALYVLASHVAPYALVPRPLDWLPGLVAHGQAAVDVFFILSGLVITQSVAAFGGRAGPFLLARAGRTYPVYLACLALTVAVLALPPPAMPWLHGPLDIWPHPPADHGAARLGLHVLMLQGLPPQGVLPDVWVGYLGSAWSLSTEWQFYLAVVLIWPPDPAARQGGAMRRLALAFLALATVGAMWQASAAPGLRFSRAFLPLEAQYFALGIASLGVVRGEPGARRHALAVLLACILLSVPGGAGKALTPLVWAACLAAQLGLGGGALRPLAWGLRLRPVRWLGAISYPLYLVHEPVQKAAGHVAARIAEGNGGVFDLIFLPAAIGLPLAVAAALHRWVEVPGIAWSRSRATRLLAASAGKPAVSPAA